MTGVETALLIGATAVSAGGAYLSGVQQQAMAEAQAVSAQQQAESQAQLAEYQAQQQINAAIAQNQALEFEALQLERKANSERAMAQREYINAQRDKRLAQSKVVASAAAGGGSTLDPSVVDIIGDLEAEGKYNADSALYTGETAARSFSSQATLNRYEGALVTQAADAEASLLRQSGDIYRATGQTEANLYKASGKNAKKAGTINAVSNVFSGGAKVAGKYA